MLHFIEELKEARGNVVIITTPTGHHALLQEPSPTERF